MNFDINFDGHSAEEVAEAAIEEDTDALTTVATVISAWLPTAAAAFSFLVVRPDPKKIWVLSQRDQ